VHTDVVVEEKVTGRPEEAVALRAKVLAPKVWLEIPAKEMVWLAAATAKVSLTGVAAA
jgi:hypothetical protein